jgi:ubiquinone/menaquinone biosynthesis C-methylase UbiE
MNDTFITRAADWDRPDKINMSKKFADELISSINPLPDWKALEIGAGTGLVGLLIEPLVRTIVMEDTSESMLQVLKQKLNGNSKVEIVHGEVTDYKLQDIDLIFSNMAFHHIPDIEKTLQHLASITKTGAWIVIGDLVTEDGSFHHFEPIPHKGFDTSALSGQFEQAGFEVKSVKTHNVISKIVENITSEYEQFILIAQKV